MEISAKQVKELRDLTGCGIMDCKKAEDQADHRDERGDDHRQIEAVGDGSLYALGVARAVPLARDDGKARDHAVRGTEHQEHDRARRANGSEGFGVNASADDESVHDVIKLLGNIA